MNPNLYRLTSTAHEGHFMTTNRMGWMLASLLAFAIAAMPARAIEVNVKAVSNQPAATLLLPYFEATLKTPAAGKQPGPTTYMTIVNTSATAVLAKVTVWSDLGVAVLGMHTYLTGYDSQTFDLGDLIRTGKMPATASAGQDPQDTISNKGVISQDINFANCAGKLPFTQLPADFVAHVKASLTGQFSSVFGGCAGRNVGDGLARGFVTVDAINNCTDRSPGDPGYFVAGGAGDATLQNVLTGDYQYVNASTGVAEGDSLVPVQADALDSQTSNPGEYTFYGKFVDFSAADNRQPLATNFAVRYRKDATVFTGGTSILAWRDQKIWTGPFACGTTPSWYPLGQQQIAIFDEQENPVVPVSIPVSPPPPVESLVPFPAVANKVKVGSSALPVPYDSGWIFANLNTTVSPAPANTWPPEDTAASQGWMTTVFEGKTLHALSPGVPMDSATAASHLIIGGF